MEMDDDVSQAPAGGLVPERGLELNPGVLHPVFHDVQEDRVQALVDLLDHVEHASVEPDEIELDQRLLVHLPARRRGVVGRICSGSRG